MGIEAMILHSADMSVALPRADVIWGTDVDGCFEQFVGMREAA